MVSLACPPICLLHAACARLPATQTHSAMCVCFTHPHCMSVLCGPAWPVLPGGGHCPRSPGGLNSGHRSVWCGTLHPLQSSDCLQQPRAGSETSRNSGPGGSHRERPSLAVAQEERPCSLGASYRLVAGGHLCGGQRSWSVGSRPRASLSGPVPLSECP